MNIKNVNRMVLKLHRVAVGRNQTSLAQQIGRSQAWLCRVERGERGSVVTDKDLQNLGAALGVSADALEER